VKQSEEERSRAFPRDVVKRLMFRVLNYFWVFLAFVCVFCVCVVQNNNAAAASLCIFLHVTCFLLVLSLVLSSFSAIDDNSNNIIGIWVFDSFSFSF